MTAMEWDTAPDLWDEFNPYKHRLFRDRERLRLLACACARRVLNALGDPPDPVFPGVVEVAEKYATGRATRPELLAVRKELRPVLKGIRAARRWSASVDVFAELTDDTIEGFEHMLVSSEKVLKKSLGRRFSAEKPILSALVRDVFGNPFRPVVFDPAWRTANTTGLASAVYDAGSFAGMPILADALEEAGCDHPHILTHCRDVSAVHACGCWVVELVRGKS
jgi:hypothetical protein